MESAMLCSQNENHLCSTQRNHSSTYGKDQDCGHDGVRRGLGRGVYSLWGCRLLLRWNRRELLQPTGVSFVHAVVCCSVLEQGEVPVCMFRVPKGFQQKSLSFNSEYMLGLLACFIRAWGSQNAVEERWQYGGHCFALSTSLHLRIQQWIGCSSI